jgi:hypothetical protein
MNSSIKIYGEHLNKHLFKEDMQMRNKPMKWFSTPYISRKIITENENKNRILEWSESAALTPPIAKNKVEKQEVSFIAD